MKARQLRIGYSAIVDVQFWVCTICVLDLIILLILTCVEEQVGGSRFTYNEVSVYIQMKKLRRNFFFF